MRKKKRNHKNSFGHVLLIAGSKRMLGAGVLSAAAAFRSGAGLVTLAVPESLNQTAHRKLPSAVMTWPLPETPEQTLQEKAAPIILKKSKHYQALGLGPGLGTHPSTTKCVQTLINKCSQPLVIDAQALNVLSANLNMIKHASPSIRILTPHIGEMQRLTKKSKDWILKYRKRVTQELADQLQAVILLKGHETLVCGPGKRPYTNSTGNAGMATAGTGDCLTGIITAFLAQGLNAFDAAKYGCYIHGLAGDLAAEKLGQISLMADDIISFLPEAFRKVLAK